MRRVLFAPLLVVASSCTFPDVQFGDASVPIDSGSDVVVVNDAGDDGADAAFDPCDKDHDGYKAEGGACGGNDCNDNNSLQHPGQTQFIEIEPDAAPFGDWNCDGQLEKEYPFVACGIAQSCNAISFSTDTGCGITNPFVSCTGTLCAAVDAGTRTQGCR